MRFVLMATVLGLAACTAPSQGLLNQATAACGYGDRLACAQLPALNAQVQVENQQNQVATGAAVGLGALVGGALIAGSGHRHYYGRPYYGRHFYGPHYGHFR